MRIRRALALYGMAAFALSALSLPLLLAAQSAPRPAAAPRPAHPPAAAVPFRAGEQLEYRVEWESFLTAASLRMEVREQREFRGGHAWHFQALVNSLNPVRYLYAVDDQFDSYLDAAGLHTRQFELYLRESRKIEDRILRLATEGEPVEGGATVVRVPAGTRDPLGAIYFFRTADWKRSPEITIPIYDGRRLYTVRARRDLEGAVEVPAGEFLAERITLRIFEQQRERTDLRIHFWLAKDPQRTPVQIEATLPFGNVRVQLASAPR
jgi:hypothetical protein